MLLLQWFLFYVSPAVVAFFFKKNTALVHVLVVCSIVLLSLTGAYIVWNLSAFPIMFLCISIIFAVFVSKSCGVWYTVSSFLQEWCLLLAGSFLASFSGIYSAAILTAVPFALTHTFEGKGKHWKFILLIACGALSIYVYSVLHQPFINVALHITIGTLFSQKIFTKGIPR